MSEQSRDVLFPPNCHKLLISCQLPPPPPLISWDSDAKQYSVDHTWSVVLHTHSVPGFDAGHIVVFSILLCLTLPGGSSEHSCRASYSLSAYGCLALVFFVTENSDQSHSRLLNMHIKWMNSTARDENLELKLNLCFFLMPFPCTSCLCYESSSSGMFCLGGSLSPFSDDSL